MQRSFYLFALFLLVTSSIYSQVPNGGFESWTAGSPDGWLTNNIPGEVTPITQSNSSHSGSSALKGQVESYSGFLFTPQLFSTTEDAYGFPVSTRYNSMKGYFKFNPVEGDIVHITIGLTLNSEVIGVGAHQITTGLNDYTELNIPIQYVASGTPDTALIHITILGPAGNDYHLGSEFYVDDLSLSENIVGVEDVNLSPVEFKLAQNYPNPFNPSTSINYEIPARSYVSLKVYNILGNEVAHLVNENKEPGIYSVKFDASSLPSGVYIYNLKAGNFTTTKKMILTK